MSKTSLNLKASLVRSHVLLIEFLFALMQRIATLDSYLLKVDIFEVKIKKNTIDQRKGERKTD